MHEHDEKDEVISGEQAADLAALQSKVNDDMQAAQNAEPEQTSRPELANEFKVVIMMATGALTPAFPSLAEIYTEETAGAAAHAMASLCNKYGWLQDGIGGKWAEEIAAGAILLPLAWATYQGVQADIAKRAKKQPEKALAMPEQPQEPVIFGSPVTPIDEPASA